MMEFIIIHKEFWMRFLRKKSSYVVIGYFLENDLGRLLVDMDSKSTTIFHSPRNIEEWWFFIHCWTSSAKELKKGSDIILFLVVFLLLYPGQWSRSVSSQSDDGLKKPHNLWMSANRTSLLSSEKGHFSAEGKSKYCQLTQVGSPAVLLRLAH